MRRQGNNAVSIHAPWWEPGESVLIYEVVKHGHQKEIMRNLLSARVGAGDASMSLNFRMQEVQGAMVRVMVKDWTFRDEKGVRIPFTPEAVDELADEDVEYIAGQVSKNNPTDLTPEDRAKLFAKAETTSSAN